MYCPIIRVEQTRQGCIIREMFELYLQPGQSGKTITKEMALRGIRTRKGRPYAHGRVDEMLKNLYYVGLIQWDGKQYPGKHETFIDRALWDRVHEKNARWTTYGI